MQKYYTKIFGCQMNQSDAERISAILTKCKFKQTASIDEADFVIFVTCGVRQSAEDRVYGQINNIRKKFPGKYIILTGCLAHRKDVQRRLKGKVDLFFPINNPISLISLISRKKTKKGLALRNPPRSDLEEFPDEKSGKGKVVPCMAKPSFDPKSNYLKITPSYTNSHTAYIPIMTGCNNFCTYCVVPYARGREYSRPVEDILKEVRALVKKGCKEIVFLGQNVNSYNSPLYPKLPKSPQISFPKLLRFIEKIPGKFWLTFLTSHPKDMSDELIETIAKSKKICEYISLPAQSSDDEILRKMNRHYTVAHYKNLIKKIRATYKAVRPHSSLVARSVRFWQPLPSISTDIIVGFPGETKKQFENTAKLFREMKFDMAYISQYSPRPETLAWKLEDNVSRKEKARREKVLTKMLEMTALANNREYIGKIVEVLIDKIIPNSPDTPNFPNLPKKYSGHTRTQKKVLFYSNKKIPVGSFVKVKITKAKAFGLEGEMF